MEKFEKDATYALILSAQAGDESAKSQLVNENMGLVLSIAKKFYNRGYDKDDINQLGSMGLLRAINNFNTQMDVKFSTYAVPMIMGEIKRFLRDDGPLKVSRNIKRTASQILHFVETTQAASGETPGVNDIADALGISVEDVLNAQEATNPPDSIFSERNDGDRELLDYLKDEIDESKLLTKIDIKSALASLPERDKTIIIMRYFLDKTQSDIAKKLGISQVQVSRLEKRILNELKNALACEN